MYITSSICSYIFFIFLIKQSKSLEINNENCLNNNSLTSKCVFHINIKPPIDKKLECRFKFDDPNDGIVDVTINNMYIMNITEMEDKCPSFSLKLFYLINETAVQVPCANKIGYKSRKLNHFTSGHLVYDNKGLLDTTTAINVTVELTNQKSCEVKTLYWYIIVGITAVVLVVIILLIVMVMVIKHGMVRIKNRRGSDLLYEFSARKCIQPIPEYNKTEYGIEGDVPTDMSEPEYCKHVGIRDPTAEELV